MSVSTQELKVMLYETDCLLETQDESLTNQLNLLESIKTLFSSLLEYEIELRMELRDMIFQIEKALEPRKADTTD